MTWKPATLAEIEQLIHGDLADCSPDLIAYFARVRIAPGKWQQHRFGDEGGGFWAVAIDANRVLWWNDIEEGWNVSTFSTRGRIPDDEYWCNEDPLKWALPFLQGKPGTRLGPPQPPPLWPAPSP
jgi:hypothetical protein